MVFEKFTSADLSQIARAKPCDYFLIIYMQKIWLAFHFLRLTACQKFLSSLLQLTTLTKIGLNFDRWILMDKIAEAKLKICLPRTQAFCHFTFLTFHVFPLPPRKEIQLLTRFLCIVVLCLLGFWLRKASQLW